MPDPAPNTCQHCSKPLPPNNTSKTCPACLIAEAFNPLDSLDDSLSSPHDTSLAPSPDPSQTDPLEGTTLGPDGRYKILQRIGEGGFGTVFMAEQTAPVRRRVAIKILKAGMDTRQVVARFEAERQALAMMDHPNIAKVLDGGETDRGRPFFVMELVRGTPVTTFCDREKLDTRQRLDLFLKVCRAVQHAHQKGIIHRDLKPANILVTVQEGAQPVPKVIDFGVAKAMEANLTDKTLFTRFEQMVGTPAYMSPEQAGTDAAANDIDTRADIYALGVLLYELLTGSTPFESATLHNAAFDEIRRILREEDAPRPSARLSSLEAGRRQTLADSRNTPSPQSLDRQLRGDLDWIVMRAIEKDRTRRYETANAFALDLERFLDDDPVEARPPSTTYRLQKFARRHKTALATAATILLILVAATTISTIAAIQATDANHRASKNYDDLQSAYTDLDTSRQETERQRNEALWNQYVARQFPIRQAWEQRDFGHLERLLDELVPEPGQPDFRGWEWTYFKDQCDQAFTTVEGRLPAWDQKEMALSVVREDTDGRTVIVLVSPSDGSTIRKLAELPPGEGHEIYNLRWSSDGSRVAYLDTVGLAVVLERESSLPLFIKKIPMPERRYFGEPEVRSLDLNPDGTQLITGTWSGNIQVWNVETGKPSYLIQAADSNSHLGHHSLRLNPRSEHLAAALRKGRRTTWRLPSGEAFEYERQSETGGTVAWNHSGTRFASTDRDSFALYSLNHAKPQAILPHRSVIGLSWIGDERLVSFGADQVIRIWNSEDHDEIATYRVADELTGSSGLPTADLEGKFLAVPTSNEVKIIDLEETIDPAVTLTPGGAPLIGDRHPIIWHRLGRRILSGHIADDGQSTRSRIRIWDVARRSISSEVSIGIARGLGWNSDQTAVHAIRLGGRLLEYGLDTDGLTELGSFPEQEGFQSAFSPDGRWLLVPQRKSVTCIDMRTGNVAESWNDPPESLALRLVRWSPEGRSVGLGYEDTLVVWKPFDAIATTQTTVGARIHSIAWKPDRTLIALGGRDGRCRILDSGTLETIVSLAGHTGLVLALDWAENGRLASASTDSTVRVWDDATGDELLAFQHPGNRKFISVRWCPEGLRLAASDEEGRVFIWGSTDMQPRPTGATGLTTGTIAR